MVNKTKQNKLDTARAELNNAWTELGCALDKVTDFCDNNKSGEMAHIAMDGGCLTEDGDTEDNADALRCCITAVEETVHMRVEMRKLVDNLFRKQLRMEHAIKDMEKLGVQATPEDTD